MSRKDYIAVAKEFALLRKFADEATKAVCDEHAKTMARVFACDNSNFDKERFLAACKAE